MLTDIHPKLPMRDKMLTKAFYLEHLSFELVGDEDFEGYLMLYKDKVEIHFFEFKALNPLENYGQVYIRTTQIEALYQLALERQLNIPTLGHLSQKPWGQMEFSLLDPDHNLLTFGQTIAINF
jgi:catechol 2,3-dioxygenase-like lactoylglutathione lyase family enzyme